MAILDGDNIFGEAVANTAIGTYTTDIIDLGADHVGYNQKVIINVTTAFATSASGTVTFNILTSDSSSMSSTTTLWTSGAIAAASLTAGTVYEFTLPWKVLQYLEVQQVIATGALTNGKFTAYIDSCTSHNL